MNDKQIAYTISILQQETAERDKRIEGLWDTVVEHAEHIEELERRTVELTQRLARLEVMHNLNCE